MNLLARILSHGFAFAVVALIILVLMYRGEFPLWELPESLTIKGMPSATEEVGSGTVYRTADDAKQPAEAATAAVPLEAPEEPPVLATATDTREATQPDIEVPAADTEPPALAIPETQAERQVEPSQSEAGVGSDTTGTAINSQPVEENDETSTIPPLDSDDSTVQSTDEASAETTRETPTDTGGTAADESAIKARAVLVPIDADSGGDKEFQTPDDTTIAPDDVAAGTVTSVETATVSATEEIDPAETTLTAVEQADTTQAATEELAATADSITAVEPLAAPVSEEAQQPVDNAVSGTTPYEVMAKAREAFWLRDFELAEEQYRKLIQLEPDNPDGYGEMGNMYFSQGKWEEAAAAYYQAGARLLSDGLVEQARQMVDVIRGLNGSQADDLEAQINAASVPSP